MKDVYKTNINTWIIGTYYPKNSQVKLPTNLAKWFVDKKILTPFTKEK